MTGKRPRAAAPANAAWGGRFAGGPAEIMQRINVSIDFDKRLYAQDIAGSLAHARCWSSGASCRAKMARRSPAV